MQFSDVRAGGSEPSLDTTRTSDTTPRLDKLTLLLYSFILAPPAARELACGARIFRQYFTSKSFKSPQSGLACGAFPPRSNCNFEVDVGNLSSELKVDVANLLNWRAKPAKK